MVVTIQRVYRETVQLFRTAVRARNCNLVAIGDNMNIARKPKVYKFVITPACMFCYDRLEIVQQISLVVMGTHSSGLNYLVYERFMGMVLFL